MKFLNAKQVRLAKYIGNRRRCESLETWDSKTQYFYLEMATTNSPDKAELILTFDIAHPAPKELSIYVEQKTTTPIQFELKLLYYGESKPYLVQNIAKYATKFKIEQGTNRIIIACSKDKNAGKITRAILHAEAKY